VYNNVNRQIEKIEISLVWRKPSFVPLQETLPLLPARESDSPNFAYLVSEKQRDDNIYVELAGIHSKGGLRFLRFSFSPFLRSPAI